MALAISVVALRRVDVTCTAGVEDGGRLGWGMLEGGDTILIVCACARLCSMRPPMQEALCQNPNLIQGCSPDSGQQQSNDCDEFYLQTTFGKCGPLLCS